MLPFCLLTFSQQINSFLVFSHIFFFKKVLFIPVQNFSFVSSTYPTLFQPSQVGIGWKPGWEMSMACIFLRPPSCILFLFPSNSTRIGVWSVGGLKKRPKEIFTWLSSNHLLSHELCVSFIARCEVTLL